MKKLLLSCLICLSTLAINAKILHSEKSLYRNIIVEEKSGRRCMIFGRLSKHPDQQSCIDRENPDYLVFSYTKLVMAGLAMQPNPKSILIVGLGGGTLPMSFEKVYPNTKIDTVEIDISVLNVAKQWFDYTESDNQNTHTIDGRVFVKRQLRRNKQYDLVILDAFNGDYIPEHLMTEEFLNEIKQSLNSEGLLIANTFSRNKLYHNESVTYQKVFGKFNYIHSKRSGNRIIYAKKNGNPYEKSLLKNDRIIRELTEIGVNFVEFEKLLTNEPDWKENARPLTDQYSPANLLNQ
ncbi:MAG: spermidine synthase [Enterobacterales bacterium]|jgi:spermidine synthase